MKPAALARNGCQYESCMPSSRSLVPRPTRVSRVGLGTRLLFPSPVRSMRPWLRPLGAAFGLFLVTVRFRFRASSLLAFVFSASLSSQVVSFRSAAYELVDFKKNLCALRWREMTLRGRKFINYIDRNPCIFRPTE